MVKLKFRIVLIGFLLLISIGYLVTIMMLIFEPSQIDSSPEGAIKHYLNSMTSDYRIISLTLKEEKFRELKYHIECECDFKNEEYKGVNEFIVTLIYDLEWIVVNKMEEL